MNGSVDDLIVVYVGTIYRDYGEWAVIGTQDKNFRGFRKILHDIGVSTCSTVTYVNTDGKNILIDTGYEYPMRNTREILQNKNRVLHNLSLYGIKPEDIDEIFITHWHGDHTGNIPCFPNAHIFYAGVIPSFVRNRLKSYSVTSEYSRLDENDEWHMGMKILSTPGHAGISDHSVMIRFQRKSFVVASDIIVSKSFYHNRAFWPNEWMEKNLGLLKSSYDKIVELADVIIPGHDAPFNNYLKHTTA